MSLDLAITTPAPASSQGPRRAAGFQSRGNIRTHVSEAPQLSSPALWSRGAEVPDGFVLQAMWLKPHACPRSCKIFSGSYPDRWSPRRLHGLGPAAPLPSASPRKRAIINVTRACPAHPRRQLHLTMAANIDNVGRGNRVCIMEQLSQGLSAQTALPASAPGNGPGIPEKRPMDRGTKVLAHSLRGCSHFRRSWLPIQPGP